MRITPIDHGLDLTAPAPGYVRTPGLHMSEIFGEIYKQIDPKRYGRESTEAQRAAYMAPGLALEEALESMLRDKLTRDSGRPGEFVSPEGIIYSPDLIIFNDTHRVGEIKLTWMSCKEVPRVEARSFPPQFDKYFTQMKSYSYCLDTPYARLYAFFVNGDYKARQPEFLAWDVEFSKRELEDNWRMIINAARSMGRL